MTQLLTIFGLFPLVLVTIADAVILTHATG